MLNVSSLQQSETQLLFGHACGVFTVLLPANPGQTVDSTWVNYFFPTKSNRVKAELRNLPNPQLVLVRARPAGKLGKPQEGLHHL